MIIYKNDDRTVPLTIVIINKSNDDNNEQQIRKTNTAIKVRETVTVKTKGIKKTKRKYPQKMRAKRKVMVYNL